MSKVLRSGNSTLFIRLLVDSTLVKLVSGYITCGLLITSYGKNNELFGKKIRIKLGNTEYFTNFNNLNNKIAKKSLYDKKNSDLKLLYYEFNRRFLILRVISILATRRNSIRP